MTDPIQPEKKKHAGGRPRKITKFLASKIFLLLGKGLTEQEVADVFDINKDTITELKKQAEFSVSIARCKDEADRRVVGALYQRAIGYEHPEDKIFQYEGVPVIVPTIKHYPPDTAACELWLRNRRRQEWGKKDGEEGDTEAKRALNIRLFSPVAGQEIHEVRQSGSQVDVLLGADFVESVKAKK